MSTQIQEYSATEAGLQELRQRMQGVVYDVATTAGMKQAEIDRQQRELEEARAKAERMVTCPKCGHEFDPKAEEREAA